MKYIGCLCFLLFCTVRVSAQVPEEEKVKKTVVDFFKAFHAQDTVALKSFAYDVVILQSVSKDPSGRTMLDAETYEEFVKSIGSIPANIKFEERLLSYHIQVDGDMANAWTPYEFYINGNFSHCGVDSFQFIKVDGVWKIIYLIDTRRKEGCTK